MQERVESRGVRESVQLLVAKQGLEVAAQDKQGGVTGVLGKTLKETEEGR
jgi:hypothetical protein